MILIRAKSSSLLLRCLAAKCKCSTLFSTSQSVTSRHPYTSNVADSSTATPFIVKYLIDSVGFSPSEATKASKLITHIKSPSKPESALKFFRENGFSDTDIKRIVFKNSRVLCANVDFTLKPKLEGLRELGFSESQIKKLITANPSCLRYLSLFNLRPRIEFLSTFLCSHDDFVKAFILDDSFLSGKLEEKLKPNVFFLRESQISNEKIGSLMTLHRKIFGRSLNSLKSIVERVVEFGFPNGSGMFYRAFRCFANLNAGAFDAKVKFLGTLGFSSAELFSALLKEPKILELSVKNLSEKVDFLVKEAGCDLSYISRYPGIVSLSLNKRLIPRNYVLQLLKEKGLLKNNGSFYSIVILNEKRFLGRFIFSFIDKIPELHDIYVSASEDKFCSYNCSVK